MSRFAMLAATTALALSGCGGGEDNESGNAANAMAQGRTENGQITARVQGVDLKVNLPPPIRRMTEDNDLLPPGARAERGSQGQRFHSDDPPATVARWYQESSRTSPDRFVIGDLRNEGSAIILTGGSRGGLVTIRLSPGASGGTDGTVVVTARN